MYAEININKKGSVPLTLTIKYHFKKINILYHSKQLRFITCMY